MQDIADKVGVSKALVSLVIRKAPGPSDETRARSSPQPTNWVIGSIAPQR